MPDRPASGERWVKTSAEVPASFPAAALLRATVAGMRCRECIEQDQPAQATVQLALMHDAIAALREMVLDDAGANELDRLVDLEQALASRLRRAG